MDELLVVDLAIVVHVHVFEDLLDLILLHHHFLSTQRILELVNGNRATPVLDSG